LIYESWRHALACASGLRSRSADLVSDLRFRSVEVRFNLLSDDLANMLSDGLHNLVGNVGVARRFKPPRFVRSEIHVAQKRRGASTLHRNDASIDVRPAKSLDLLDDVLVVYAVERPERSEEPISPTASHGVAMAAHKRILVGDEPS
jgi:hypothetical protein